MILYRSENSFAKALAKIRLANTKRVNEMVGEVRLDYITDIPGQAATYADKEKEAREYLSADPEPVDLAPYPFIASESQATGITPNACAQMFLNLAAYWRPMGAALEGLRRGYITQVEAATSEAQIELLMSDLDATLEVYRRD